MTAFNKLKESAGKQPTDTLVEGLEILARLGAARALTPNERMTNAAISTVLEEKVTLGGQDGGDYIDRLMDQLDAKYPDFSTQQILKG